MDFWFSFSTPLLRRRWRAFSVTFDCAKVTKAHRGHFKPSPGPPGEGVTFSPPSPAMRHLRSPATPGSHEEPVLLPVCFTIGPGTSLKLYRAAECPANASLVQREVGSKTPEGLQGFRFFLLNFTF